MKNIAEQRSGGRWNTHLIQKAWTPSGSRLPLAWILESPSQPFNILYLFLYLYSSGVFQSHKTALLSVVQVENDPKPSAYF